MLNDRFSGGKVKGSYSLSEMIKLIQDVMPKPERNHKKTPMFVDPGSESI